MDMVGELLKLAGHDLPLAGLKPDEVVGINGGLAHRETPARFEPYASILTRANRNELVADGTPPMPFELQRWSMHSYGAMFCEVRVNAVTSEPRVSRFLGSFDCGKILNQTAASQFRGGIIMGIGLALTEETRSTNAMAETARRSPMPSITRRESVSGTFRSHWTSCLHK